MQVILKTANLRVRFLAFDDSCVNRPQKLYIKPEQHFDILKANNLREVKAESR